MKAKIENKKGKVSKISLISEKDYIARGSKSGSPLILANKDSRLYSNPRVNGSTATLLAAISTFSTVKKSVTIPEYEEGVKKLLSDNFKNEDWKRLEAIYPKFGGKSKSPALKINPVLKALLREGKNGSFKGFDITNIGSEVERKAFGFNF